MLSVVHIYDNDFLYAIIYEQNNDNILFRHKKGVKVTGKGNGLLITHQFPYECIFCMY